VQNTYVIFFMLMWAWCRSHKKHAGTHYVKLVLLYLMRFIGDIVHSGMSEA
jgi:hypothetical protein